MENVNYTVNSETHTAKATQTATVLTMAEWKAQGAPVGPYWVYDTDGWAYWAQPILPGEATGLLLDGIELNEVIQDDWYYGINVVGQFSDGGDWGQAEGNGFYTDAASEMCIRDRAECVARCICLPGGCGSLPCAIVHR